MTRINVGIPPKDLSRQHLLAEHREIKRIPNVVSKGKFSLKDQPKIFKLGTGHVKFFYDKLGYLKKRYEEIYEVCCDRKYNVTYYGDSWKNVPPHLMGDYEPTEEDIKLIKDRISEKEQQTRI